MNLQTCRIKKRRRLLSAICLATTFILLSTLSRPADATGSGGRKHLFAVVPQHSSLQLTTMWGPFVAHLAIETGLNIQLTTAKDITTFERCLAQGAYEFAYMNPYHYTMFHARSGYQAFAHQTQKKLRGLLVTRKASAIRSLAELEGKSVAFPSPGAFGASILTQAEIRHRNIRFAPKYVKSHDSVYRAVAAGLYAAGGGVARTFGKIPHAVKAQLQVIHYTEEYTPHAFAALAGIPADVITRVRDAMTNVARRSPAIIAGLGMDGIEAATDETWNDVRALELDQNTVQATKSKDVKCRFD